MSSESTARTPPTPSLLATMSPSKLLSRTRLKLIASMFKQMCDAVATCHEDGVYHRDIKPDNLLFDTSTHHVVIGDFGLAVTPDELAYRRSLTKKGQMEFVGTLEYMSREVWIDGLYSEASDMFAAGCVLFEGHLARVSFLHLPIFYMLTVSPTT